MEIVPIRTPSLGDTSYLLAHGGGGVIVDPQRDIGRYLEAADRAGVTVSMVLETHVHNDYLSGGPELARRTGAELVLPAAAGVAFPNRPAFHGEEIDVVPGLAIRPLHTPGHTPEHTSYLVELEQHPAALFSGGSLLYGSSGRTDLLGEDLSGQLARLQHGSLQRLAALPPSITLHPTHGGGSFCTAGAVERDRSTLGEERAHNPLLSVFGLEESVDLQLSTLLPYPSYYASMAPINRLGAPPMPRLDPPELDPDDIDRLQVAVIDGRTRVAFAAGHLPGALGIELGDSFASWVGWLVPFATPLVLVLDQGDEARLATLELARIGYDDVRGVLRGMGRWESEGRPVSRHPLAAPGELVEAMADDAQVLDVRDPQEWAASHLAGSVHCYVPDLITALPDLDPARPVWVVCASGFRSSIAAGLLQRAGLSPVVVTPGGVGEAVALGADEATD